jgi:hypothetical protein
MGETTTRLLLIAILVSFFAFGLAHDFDFSPDEAHATGVALEHSDPIPHVEEICALTLIGAGLLIVRLSRSLLSYSTHVRVECDRTSSSSHPRTRPTDPSPGFQLSFPMLA